MNTKQEQQHHYFATTALYFAVGATRQEAIDALAKRFTAEELRYQRIEHGGTYVWTARVALPQGTAYAIDNYMPVVKKGALSSVVTCRLVDRKGNVRLTD